VQDTSLKKIKASIEPSILEEVIDSLDALGIEGVIISKCKDVSDDKGLTTMFRGKEEKSDIQAIIRMEMVVEKEIAGRVVEIIQEKDGLVSVLPIETVIPVGINEEERSEYGSRCCGP
jgi:nitrogen regulatory protein P-II 1